MAELKKKKIIGPLSFSPVGVATTIEMDIYDRMNFLDSILASSTEYSIVAMDLHGVILAWNEGARRIYGYEPNEVLGKSSFLLHDPHDVKSGKAQKIIDEVIKKEKWTGELLRIRKNSEFFLANVTMTLRKDSEGRPMGLTLISRDMTLQKKLEEQTHKFEEKTRLAQEANRLKSEFLANMSHELRTPLNAIIGFAELMYSGKVGAISEEHKEYLGDILTSSNHLMQLINDVLDLAKVEAGKMDFRPEPVNLTVLIAEVKDVLNSLSEKKQISLTIKVDPALTDIVIDSAKLKQILFNFVSNALKFTPAKGSIEISASPVDEDKFKIHVKDNGIGIKKENLSKLFQEFHQLHSGTSKKYAGTGLGLALTKHIVEAQGGQVGVESTEGEGSTFYAILPKRNRPRYQGKYKSYLT